jgi:hypothetical protein
MAVARPTEPEPGCTGFHAGKCDPGGKCCAQKPTDNHTGPETVTRPPLLFTFFMFIHGLSPFFISNVGSGGFRNLCGV